MYNKKADSQMQRAKWWFSEEGRVGGQYGTGEQEAPAVGCKTGLRMYCSKGQIQPIFCNNCKWKVTFKNCIKKRKKNLKNIKRYTMPF